MGRNSIYIDNHLFEYMLNTVSYGCLMGAGLFHLLDKPDVTGTLLITSGFTGGAGYVLRAVDRYQTRKRSSELLEEWSEGFDERQAPLDAKIKGMLEEARGSIEA